MCVTHMSLPKPLPDPASLALWISCTNSVTHMSIYAYTITNYVVNMYINILDISIYMYV